MSKSYRMKLKDQYRWRMRNGSSCMSCYRGTQIYLFHSQMSKLSQVESTHMRMMYIK